MLLGRWVSTDTQPTRARRRGFRPKEEFNAKDAWIIGAGQCIALIPGSSRSGSTIMTALFRRVTHDYAARFSFVMSIPAITAAGGASCGASVHM